MNNQQFDLLIGGCCVVSMIFGAIFGHFFGAGATIVGACVYGIIVGLRDLYIRRMNATNERSTSKDVDV